MGNSNNIKYGFDYDTFFNLIDNMYDEVYVTDNNYKLLYVNKSCARHYGVSQDEMIGKTSFDFDREKWWTPGFLKPMYKDKKAYSARQFLANGTEVLTIATPIFDQDDNIDYVIMNVRDDVNDIDLYNSHCDPDIHTLLKEPDDFIFKSDAMNKIYDMAKKISNLDTTCIITGETGVGKTMLAKHIHNMSDKKDKPFISVNCASLPSELIESELFGYSKGAFTGANTTGKKGFIELADGGTLLLDEVSELPLAAQAKILHVVQEKEFFPVGANEPIKVDVRIIAATNKSLKTLAQHGHFREDLYYRLNVVDLYIPPLRKRVEDIPHLVYHFLGEFSQKYNMNRKITDRAIEVLVNYNWKGNIRELKHVIERMFVTSDTIVLDLQQLPTSLFGIEDQTSGYEDIEDMDFDNKMSVYEGYLIRQAYDQHKTSRKVAEALNLSQTRATKLIQKHVKK